MAKPLRRGDAKPWASGEVALAAEKNSRWGADEKGWDRRSASYSRPASSFWVEHAQDDSEPSYGSRHHYVPGQSHTELYVRVAEVV